MQEQISSTLKTQWNYQPLRAGERRVYQLTGLKLDQNGMLRCPIHKGIPNNYLVEDYEDGEKTGRGSKSEPARKWRTVRYITGQRPSRDGNGYIDILGSIAFTREQNGKIILHGGNSQDAILDEFLFFHPWNEAGVGKPGHSRPKGGYRFTIVDNHNYAVKTINFFSNRRKAEELIEFMSEADVQRLGDAVIPNESFGLKPVEIRAALLNWAQDEANVRKVLNFDKDYNLELRKIVAEAQTKNIIALSLSGSQWMWASTSEVFHHVSADLMADPVKSLVVYFATLSGETNLNHIKAFLEEKVPAVRRAKKTEEEPVES
jgi:hypothetical protein